MLGAFDQLVGAAGDVKELEYISALHQTDTNHVRTDASIRAEDIRLFLSSRYGIVLDQEQVSKVILQGFTTSVLNKEDLNNNDDDDENEDQQDDDDDESTTTDASYYHPAQTLDLVELVCVLLLPTFLKAARNAPQESMELQEEELDPTEVDLDHAASFRHSKTNLPQGVIPAPPGMLGYVLKMILHDVTGNSQPKPITTDLVKRILIGYGEYELAQDDILLQEMVDAATGRASATMTTSSSTWMSRNNVNTNTNTNKAGRHSNNNSTTNDAANSDVEVGMTTSNDERQQPLEELYTELNVEAFAKALTYDIQLYDIQNETRRTTNMEDVFPYLPITSRKEKEQIRKSKQRAAAARNSKNNNGSTTSSSRHQDATDPTTANNNDNAEEVTYSHPSSAYPATVSHTQGSTTATSTTEPTANTNLHPGELLEQQYDDPNMHMIRKNTFASIDITAGTYRSKTLVILLWSTIIMWYFGYSYRMQQEFESECTSEEQYVFAYRNPWATNRQAMGCETVNSIINWLDKFWSMAWQGTFYVGLSSIGNNVECRRFWVPMIGCVAVWGLVWSSYFALPDKNPENYLLYIMAMLLGTITGLLHIVHTVQIWYYNRQKKKATINNRPASKMNLKNNKQASMMLTEMEFNPIPSFLPKPIQSLFSGTVDAERDVKKAAARKLALMVRNALEVVKFKDKDNVMSTHYGQALGNYTRKGKKYKKVGGFAWAWNRMLPSFLAGKADNQLFSRDGIWLPARMIASNIAQYVIVVYTLIGGIRLTEYVLNDWDKESARQTLRTFSKEKVRGFVEDETAGEFANNMSLLVNDYVATMDAQGLVDFGCGNIDNSTMTAEEILETYCSATTSNFSSAYPSSVYNGNLTSLATANFTGCDQNAPVNYFCPLLDPNSTLNATSQKALLAGSGFDEDLLHQYAQDFAIRMSDQAVDNLYPSEKYMISVPLIIAVVFAVMTTFYLSVTYIPSVTTTILKLRSGFIPTLQNREFNRYRRAADQVALLTGSLFWGTLVSGLLCGGFVGLVVFLFLWQGSVYFAQRIMAIVIGIVAVTLFRLSLVCICRFTLYKSFYRERPATANIVLLALEWANFALSVGFVFARSIKLLLATGMSIGRIDTPFLAPGVGRIRELELDNFPMIHLKDILSHEAHRHPYIEQLGVVYLMKLRYGADFGKRAGTCWRLIFVYALMPWLHKYRILTRPEKQVMSQHFSADPSTDRQLNFPSLQFVSLYNLNSNYRDDEDEGTTERADQLGSGGKTNAVHIKPSIPSREPLSTTKSEGSRVRFDPIVETHEAGRSRIEELEEENRKLKLALAKAQQGQPQTSSVCDESEPLHPDRSPLNNDNEIDC